MSKLIVGIIAAGFALSAFSQDKPAGAESKPADMAVPADKVMQEAKQKETEDAARAAAAERAAAHKQMIDELFKACTIKPVMTDDEIEACKKAYRA